MGAGGSAETEEEAAADRAPGATGQRAERRRDR